MSRREISNTTLTSAPTIRCCSSSPQFSVQASARSQTILSHALAFKALDITDLKVAVGVSTEENDEEETDGEALDTEPHGYWRPFTTTNQRSALSHNNQSEASITFTALNTEYSEHCHDDPQDEAGEEKQEDGAVQH